MPFVVDWLTIFVLGCLAVMSPGPNFLMTLRNSVMHSRRAGVYTAAGLALGDCVHATYCLVGIAVVISQSILLFNAIKTAGAAYLIYVGIRSLRAQKRTTEDHAHRPLRGMAPREAIRAGFLTDVLNPKVTLFFLALFTQVIRPETPTWQQALYGLTVVGIEFAWMALVAVAISQRTVKAWFENVAHWIERVTGALFIALGLRLAFARQN